MSSDAHPRGPGWATMSPVGNVTRTATAAAVQRRMELGLGAVRAVTLAWGVVVATIDASSGVLRAPAPAFALLAVLIMWSAVWTAAVGRRDRWVDGPGAAIDITLASATLVVDQFVHGVGRPQSLASAWPLVAVLATGVAVGPGWGLVGGVTVGLAGFSAAALDGDLSGRVLGLSGATVLYAAAGWTAGWVAEQLRTTAQLVAAADAREEVARTLHDGVLQTLAVVQRRSDDPALVALAREQDVELRAYLRSATASLPRRVAPTPPGTSGPTVDVPAGLGPVLARVEARHGVTVQLVVIDPGTATGTAADALVAAAGEAVTNAAKHSDATTIWVSVDCRSPSGTEVVVHDEGSGFDPATTPEGDGLTRSVRGRLAAVDGDMSLRSAPGAGCDVTLWAP